MAQLLVGQILTVGNFCSYARLSGALEPESIVFSGAETTTSNDVA